MVPGRLEQLLTIQADKAGITLSEMKERHIEQIPLRRFADPSETAAAAAFLASPAAAYITGINLPVDGGRTACL